MFYVFACLVFLKMYVIFVIRTNWNSSHNITSYVSKHATRRACFLSSLQKSCRCVYISEKDYTARNLVFMNRYWRRDSTLWRKKIIVLINCRFHHSQQIVVEAIVVVVVVVVEVQNPSFQNVLTIFLGCQMLAQRSFWVFIWQQGRVF